MTTGHNAKLVSVTRPSVDLDSGSWTPWHNDQFRGKWPVRLTGLEHALLGALLSLPPDSPWENVRGWVENLPFEESAGAKAKALAGLERKGYLHRTRFSAGRGTFRYEWTITAQPDVSAGQITSPFSPDVSTRHVKAPVLEDGQLEAGPFKNGPVSTSTSTRACARGSEADTMSAEHDQGPEAGPSTHLPVPALTPLRSVPSGTARPVRSATADTSAPTYRPRSAPRASLSPAEFYEHRRARLTLAERRRLTTRNRGGRADLLDESPSFAVLAALPLRGAA